MMLVLVGVCSILLVLVFWLIEKRSRFRSLELLPGPNGLPIVGVALEMGKNPVDFLTNLLKFMKHGKVVRFWILSRPFIFVSDPRWVEYLLTSTTHITKTIEYAYFDRWLGRGLLIANGRHWKEHRKILTPAFHFKILENSIDIFHNNAECLLENLEKAKSDEPIDIYPLISQYSLDVICEAAMGIKLDCQKLQSEESKEYFQAIKNMCFLLLTRSFSSWKRIFFLYQFSSDYSSEEKSIKILHAFTNKVIKERIETLKNKTGDDSKENDMGIKKRTNFLDLLLQAKIDGNPLTDLEIREEVDTFMFAGHDTTSSAVSFTLYELSRNPEVQDKLYAEIKEVLGTTRGVITMKDLTEMKYLELVIKEGMRKYPPVPFYARELQEDAHFDGVHLPKGLNYEVFALQLHREPEFYPEPEKFIPERFLPENMSNRPVFSYVPFSAGSRNCIGQKFAMLEMKVVIANIIQQFELIDAGAKYEPILSGEAVLRANNGLNLILKNRIN